MKVLFNLLALSCIISTACSEKILGDFNGPIHGGTFNSEVQKTNMVANVNGGQFTGGTFIGKRDQQQDINSSEVVDNEKKDKRQNIISGDMSGTFAGGTFNGKRQNIISGDMSGTFAGGTFNGKRQNIISGDMSGNFVGGSFNGKRENKRQNIISGDMTGSFLGGTFNGKRHNKRQNIISGDMSGNFVGGSFNGKRHNRALNVISGDMTGTFAGGSFNGKRDNKRQNIISGDMSGSFLGGTFNGKRDNKLPPILPDDFQGIITTDTVSVFTSNVPFTGQNVFPHSYTFVTPSGKKLNIRSKNELKTKEDRRNALVEAEKARRSGLKKGEDAIDNASDKVNKLTHDLNEKFSQFL